MIRLLLLLAIATAIAAPIFLAARDGARKSATARTRLILGASVGLAASLVTALWLPNKVPQTQGSPATIVMSILLWIIGGGFAVLCTAMLAGALLGKARD